MGKKYVMTKKRIAEIDEILKETNMDRLDNDDDKRKLIQDLGLEWEYSHYVAQKFLNNMKPLKVISF